MFKDIYSYPHFGFLSFTLTINRAPWMLKYSVFMKPLKKLRRVFDHYLHYRKQLLMGLFTSALPCCLSLVLSQHKSNVMDSFADCRGGIGNASRNVNDNRVEQNKCTKFTSCINSRLESAKRSICFPLDSIQTLWWSGRRSTSWQFV